MKNTFYILIVVALINLGCSIDSSSQYVYQPPQTINDGLESGSLEEVNINRKLIEKAINGVYQGRYRAVHGLLIFKDNKLVLEEYFPGYKYQWDAPYHQGEWINWDKNSSHYAMSVTKSITSICIGIALDKGYIKNVHQSIFDYLPDHQNYKTKEKNKITIEHLLTMTSGLEWDEWHSPIVSETNDAFRIWFQKDPIGFILERPLVSTPGNHFIYSGGNMNLLGEILKNAAQMNLADFSKKFLFDPLGIDSAHWNLFENGVVDAAGGLIISPRDMAKIGVTFLNHGKWKNLQIISEGWVDKSATDFPGNTGIKVPGVSSGRNGYAYTWWTKSFMKRGKRIDMFYASGWGGQEIMVIPQLNSVVVFTGGTYLSNVKVVKMLEDYIIPAIE